jgi:hypothetical protein
MRPRKIAQSEMDDPRAKALAVIRRKLHATLDPNQRAIVETGRRRHRRAASIIMTCSGI